jgi:thiamine biosynthesis lipoprotein
MTSLAAVRHREVPAEPLRLERDLEFGAMGGRVRLHVACRPEQVADAERDLRHVAGRIGAWAGRLTRFSPDSDLSALNRRAGAAESAVRPTLWAVLCRSLSLAERTEGLIDVGMLGARLAAEAGDDPPAAPAPWSVQPSPRGGVVRREGPVRFDLDGVGKGWIADRALDLLRHYPAALVDADGDIAVRPGKGDAWTLAVADPTSGGHDIVVLDLGGHRSPGRLGVATSGTSVHRWQTGGGERHLIDPRHHLIDPRTGRPAVTDVVQATVVAESALVAEALAKAIVISGSEEGLDLAERAGARGEVLMLDSGEVIASPRTLEWLA